MALLSYSFCMAMLHSIWQAGLLLLFYLFIERILLQKHSPLVKRNFLFVLLGTQLSLFIITFFIYLFAGGNDIPAGGITGIMPAFLPADIVYGITPWLFSGYMMILVYKMAKALYTWYAFKQQYRAGLQRPGIDLKLFTELKAHQFGIKRKVKLWLSNTINTPVTFGFFKPVILLPVALLGNITPQQAETLILHELTHIRTNDYILNWFLLISEQIFFFNPFVAMGCKRIRLEREQYCDINVIAFNYSAALYAETLVQAERIKQMIPGFQLAAVSRKKQLLHRIRFFSVERNFKQQHRVGMIAPLVGLLLLFAVYSFIIFPSVRNTDSIMATTVPAGFYPYGNTELNTEFDNTPLPEIKKTNVNAALKQVEKQRPVIERQLRKMQPFIKAMQHKAEQLAESIKEDIVVPVTIRENDATREIVIREESSGSKTASVKVYQLRFENGKWIVEPQIMVTAAAMQQDSLTKKPVKKLLPPQ